MQAESARRGAMVSILLAIATAFAAHAQDDCKPVHFDRDKSSAILRGIAPSKDGVCYTFDTGAGQTANLRVSGRNMVISVIDVGDAREVWTFRTKAQTYKFFVVQFLRSVTNEPYTVTLSIR